MDKIKKFFSEESLAIICLTIVILVSFVIFYSQDKWDSLPPFFLTCVTAIFSFFAYRHSKEKFRLELFEKRLEIYENVLKFCSIVTTHADLRKNDRDDENISESKIEGLIAASNSFRGIGYHKVKMLFSDDINDVMKELNSSFGTLIIEGYPAHHDQFQAWNDKKYKDLSYVISLTEKLPALFRPYMYFGNYKN